MLETQTPKNKPLADCQYDAVMLKGVLLALEAIEDQQGLAIQGAQVALIGIALEKAGALADDLDRLESEARK